MSVCRDAFLAARLLSVVAAGIAAWLAYRLIAHRAGARAGMLALGIVLVSPALVRYAIEAGTDTPALVSMLGSTLLVLRARSWLACAIAGALAACAVLTRGNAVFLVPAALGAVLSNSRLAHADDARPPNPALRRVLALAGYGLGLALPLAAWTLLCRRAGAVIHDRNFLNIAYELYGRDLPWDAFEASIGSRFSSLAQVLAYDPLHAAGRVAWNVIAHRARDLSELVPVWLGLAALPGLVLLARERAWRGAWLHAALCAAALAAVFYNARFALYLLPFYAAAAAVALERGHARIAPAAWRRAAAITIGAAIAASAVAAAITIGGPLAAAPREVRTAGAVLSKLGAPGDVVMARKPHVGYFAGMNTAPFPGGMPLYELLRRARAEHVRWLAFSPVECANRPEYAVLADSGVSLPGLEPMAWDGTPRHGFALYRIAPCDPDSAAFTLALVAAVDQDAARHRSEPETQLFAALQLVELGHHDRALALLDALRRHGAADARVEQIRSDAWLGLDQPDSAAVAIERALQLEPPLASRWARLGEIRARQRRFDQARVCYAHAVDMEPANARYLERLARITLERGDSRGAAATYERALRLAPRDVALRRYAMGAWQLAGETERMNQCYTEGIRLGIAPAALLGAEPQQAAANR